jgi:hypothetical protein
VNWKRVRKEAILLGERNLLILFAKFDKFLKNKINLSISGNGFRV